MAAKTRLSVGGLTAASAILCMSTLALADGPSQLTNRQLDGVTASGVFIFSVADAQALGAYRTMATAGANTMAGTNQGVQEGFQSEGGLASGVAVSYATNGARQGSPPPTSNTSVTTGGVAEGNFKMTLGGAGTVSSLGLTIQAGFTSVYGVWVPGL